MVAMLAKKPKDICGTCGPGYQHESAGGLNKAAHTGLVLKIGLRAQPLHPLW